ncbi:hypothetical protein [Pseudomonas sp. P8_250]|uniref:hypothetical protein n=1 Tax=Pseudomonas sp. P8_250 TaxID=3043446 RepID=UPI002A36FFD2|nr:hypothetical protein [Pseudomonas sp. P8_250]MDX9668667.1 hypothetical protein [Pseudomonas sp. P8_250]
MPITQAEVDAMYVAMRENLALLYYLPSWADARLEGEWVQFAQLQTKDGRRMGNAVILAVDTEVWGDKEVELHTIITDFGNVLRLTERELEEQFFPPKWKMRANRVSHRTQFITSYYEDFVS